MDRANKNKNKNTQTPVQKFGSAIALVCGDFTVDYEGDKFVFISVKVKNNPNSQYYDIVNVRVPVELYDEMTRLDNITLTCTLSNFYDKKKQSVITTLTAFEYKLN